MSREYNTNPERFDPSLDEEPEEQYYKPVRTLYDDSVWIAALVEARRVLNDDVDNHFAVQRFLTREIERWSS